MAHLILFTDEDFRGAHKHVFDQAKTLSLIGTDPQTGTKHVLADGEFPDGVSSIVILSGNWRFFQDGNLSSPFPAVLGPGLYRAVRDFKLINDRVRSMTAVAEDPTMSGEPLDGQAVLFEHAGLRGAHSHVFGPITDLGAAGFGQVTSSIVVAAGNWSFYGDTQFDDSYPGAPVFGPGIYPWVEAVGIQNDDVLSLQPSAATATIGNEVDDEVLLFEYEGFFGAHKHVFTAEPNLNAGDDNYFNDRVNSLAILSGTWSFYSDANFSALYNVLPAGPGTHLDLAQLGILGADMSSLRPAADAQVTNGQDVAGHVILFQEANFRGPHKHVFNEEADLNVAEDNSFNDSVSSIAVIDGNWRFFRNAGYDDDYPVVLGPGLYPWVENFSIRNDDISSMHVTSDAATERGEPADAHIMLFEHEWFRGAHKHVLKAEDNLNADEDNTFNDITSSIAVVAGVWETCADWRFGRPYAPLLGPGIYPLLAGTGITDDDLTSLRPREDKPTTQGQALTGHMMLFEHNGLRGAHKHVFVPEPSLNRPEDNAFNDATSSAAVLLNKWFTYRDDQFARPYDVTLGNGLFPSVDAVGIANDDMSSLQVAGARLAFTGEATINVASGQLPDPVTDGLGMSFLFQADTRLLQIETPFTELPLGSVATMRFDRAGDGSFPADGQITIPDLTVTVTEDSWPHLSSDVTFSLTTGSAASGGYSVTGSPADAAGNVKLVAAGQLAGDDFSIEVAGVVTPRPA